MPTQRETVRVTLVLKELESLSFDIDSSDVLKNLSDELQALKAKYQLNVTSVNGLVLRPQVYATNSCERARKLKLKYKRMRQRVAPYTILLSNQRSNLVDLEVTTATETELERKHQTGAR